MSDLSSRKIDKYEYPTGKDILPSNQKKIIGPGKFTYSLLGKVFEKQTKKLQIKQINKSKQLNVMILMSIHMKTSYCFQRKDKYFRTFTTKDLTEKKN